MPHDHDFIIGSHGQKVEVKSTQKGRVQRIVPGKLVYVEIKPAKDRYVFKPNKVVIKKEDGSVRHYRGEPFSTLGLTLGQEVLVVNTDEKEPTLVVKAGPTSSSSSISNFATWTIDHLRK